MENSDDEKDGVFGNCMPKELSISLTNGTKFVDEVLRGPSDRCLENFRMDKQAFYKLCDILQGKGLLRHTNRIKIEEQLAIFLFIIGHNLRTRAPPGSDIPPEILEDPRFYPYFKDCVGAVDRIHIPVMVGIDEQGPFRNKNGQLSQNVLVACSFDLRFHYVLAGWEGSASDLRVLNSALTRRNKLQTQVKLVVAACALHNYIRREKPDDWIFKMHGHDTVLQMEESLPPLEVEPPIMQVESPALDIAFDTEQLEFSSQLRDSIAGDMWGDYISDLSTM
ncbi:hypothetical protein OIU76_023059 [Salix suchowensis]|nr:hypothetical protein OIU76_023059 [Salix suchowensis]